MHAIDRTNHSPAAAARPRRRRTKAIVLHRIKHETERLVDVDGVLDFWMHQPWGVATTTIADATERLQKVQEWTRTGVPDEFLAKAFVPYHAIVGHNGVMHHFLDWDVKGAHAYPNSKLLGVAFVGDFREDALSQSQLETGTELLRNLLLRYRNEPDVLRHDDAKRRYGKTATARRPKGCPGDNFPFDIIVGEARRQAAEILANQ